MSDHEKKRVGITFAEAEYAQYTNKSLARDTMARVRQAEEKYGYVTGVRNVDNEDGVKSVRVSVSFYPTAKFYISDVVDDDYVNPRELTDEEYSGTRGLKL